MPCRAPHGLYQRAGGTQEAFLVRIQNSHQGDLGDIQAFTQQVDADQYVEDTGAQIADDFHALHRVDVGMQVTHAHTVFGEILGQILGHAFGERGNQHTLASFRTQADLGQQIVHLGRHRTDIHHRVHQARGPHHQFDDAAGMRIFIGPGCRRDKDGLWHHGLEFLEL